MRNLSFSAATMVLLKQDMINKRVFMLRLYRVVKQ